MAYNCLLSVIYFFTLSVLPFVSIAQPFKAVNLGNWLVIEGWMKPSLFDGIPNNDLLDGTQVQFKSTKFQRYISAENGGGTNLVANRSSASGWETFRLWRINKETFNLRVFNKQFVGLEGNRIVASSSNTEGLEPFKIIRNEGDKNRVRLQASNGLYLQAQSENSVTADSEGSSWEDSDPSVFQMNVVHTLQGEYQISNGYDPEDASQLLQNHRNSYITEEDFNFMSSNGLNAVRVPVGWWIANDPTPPKPFVGGSLEALDNAFTWAQKYGMKVIVDLHAAEGSQNGDQHSGTRDGYLEWGESEISSTVDVIDFLAARYADNPSLAAIELMNEPTSDINLETLKKYYLAGYNAVRKHTQDAYVILSNRLRISDSKELLPFASSLGNHVAIDVHYYNLFDPKFDSMSPQANIDFIYNQRSNDLSAVTTQDGPLSFVGEWTAEWKVSNASPEDYKKFAKAQLDVYGNATFGWAYWAYKCDPNHWSMKWMIENNLITLQP